MEHLSIPCLDPNLLHEGNSVFISLVKTNKITNLMRCIDIPLICTCNKFNLQTFVIGHCPIKIMITNFLTKPLAALSLAREKSFAMDHMDLQTMKKCHFNQLTSRSPVNTTPYCVPTFRCKKGEEQR